MKKLILLATIGIAGLINAKGTVEGKIEAKTTKVAFQLCGVMVTYYNSSGQATGQQWFTSDQPTLNACMAYQAGIIADLKSKGYNVKPQGASTDIN
ncbi:MAG: hypothetical protein MUW56_01525 [Chryseobacterium sp.]|uniref:hypothetical protein n=1 Tax=Chryseobacterium sp. TaxID=1871047 RepID=UPI0025B8A035|nr:hypothetical protein [Chryseobacterium sp.]MCJ7932333.1 hypothetical protein [Chryseobacterium sp.]